MREPEWLAGLATLLVGTRLGERWHSGTMQQLNWKRDSELGGLPCPKKDESSVASLYVVIQEDGVRREK